MSENQQQKKPTKKQHKQMRFFVSSLNTFVGQAIVENLRNDHVNDDNPHFIVGSICENENNPVPRGVFRVIDTKKITFLAKVILDSDVIIYDLNTCDLEEAEFAIKTLKMGDYQDEKILICISNVMVWSNTPPKEKKEGEELEEGEQDEPDSEGEQAEQQQQPEDEQAKKVYVKFTEKDYTLRKPLPKYELLKSVETLCMSAGNSKKNLKAYVLCSGILYGNGEDVFYNHFKQAWLQNPSELTIYGDGKNRIPTIHVRDLATFVKKVVEKPPKQSYIFAIDSTPKPTQKKIVESISKGIGTTKVKSVQYQEGVMENENFDIFVLDLRMRPSKVFDMVEEQEANQEEEEEENPEAPKKFKFQWHCKEGLAKNIQKLNKEFNEFRGLKPNRIFIQGPPASGKTYFAQQMAKHFNISHILVKDVVDQIKALPGEFGDEVRTQWEEIKAKMVEEAQAKYEAEKKKKKPKKGEEVEEFDPNKVKPRLPVETLIKGLKWRLAQNDCQNRGFILDGFPKEYQQAIAVFMKPKPTAEGEPGDPEGPKIIDSEIIPDTVIIFEAQDDYLKNIVKQLPESQIATTHYTQEGMERRIAEYRKINQKDTGNPILIDFFKENKIDTLVIECENKQNYTLDNMKSFIQRNGQFSNYMTYEQQEEESRKQKVQETIKEEEKVKQMKVSQNDEAENEEKKAQDKRYQMKMEDQKKEERQILDERSQPLRQYLADNVVPFLTEGLIEICKNPSDDPVDALAEFLFKKCLDVKSPDPSQYVNKN